MTVGTASDVADSGVAVRAAACVDSTVGGGGADTDAGVDSSAGVVVDPAGAGAVARARVGDCGGTWGDGTTFVVVAAGLADADVGGTVLTDGDSGVAAGSGKTDS